MGTKFNVTVDYKDGCKSWYYFETERKAKKKAKQLAKYDNARSVKVTISFK